VADREARRLSFGSVADDYDRYRPAPPPAALDWLVRPGRGRSSTWPPGPAW